MESPSSPHGYTPPGNDIKISDTQPRKYLPLITESENTLLQSMVSVGEAFKVQMRELASTADTMDRGILSAWSYDELHNNESFSQRAPRRSSSRRDFVCPVKIDVDTSDPSVDPTPPVPLTTGARISRLAESGSGLQEAEKTKTAEKRQRGRPNLGLSPESTTERRRAQVRTAQRTYRLRREATVASLAERNRHLEEVLDGMTASFLRLQAAAMELSEKAEDTKVKAVLQQSTEEFLALARSTYEDGPEEPEAQ